MSGFLPSLFQKATTSISSQISSTIGSVLNSVSNELSDALFKIGHGFDSVTDISSLQADSLLSGGASQFASGSDTASQIGASKSPTTSASSPSSVMGGSGTSVLQFPPDMGKFFIQFQFKDYHRPNPLEPANYQTTATIQLPIPYDLNETHLVTWNSSDTGLVGALADAAQKNFDGGPVTGANVGAALAGAAGQTAKALISRYGLRFINEDAYNTVGQLLAAIPNPNLSMFFEGPTFQTHAFKWTMHPVDAQESDAIRNIINEFRKRMLPSKATTGGSNVLNYPSMVDVTLNPDKYLFLMKRAIVESINVNYAPRGFPTFFKNTNAPTFIEFEVHIKAIEYFLADDYGLSNPRFKGDDIINIDLKSVGSTIANTVSSDLSGILGGGNG